MPFRDVAVVSCHVECPLDGAIWRRFSALQRRFPVAALMRPPHAGEDRELWLERAREAAARGPLGHHPHWTSPAHARPSEGSGDPATRVRDEAAWLSEHGLEPTLFCGGGWYMDEGVAEAVAELGYADCTARRQAPVRLRLPRAPRACEEAALIGKPLRLENEAALDQRPDENHA